MLSSHKTFKILRQKGKRCLTPRAQEYESQTPQQPSESDILPLQKSIGNQVIQKMIHSGKYQGDLKIDKPYKKYESKVNRTAEDIVRHTRVPVSLTENTNGLIQRRGNQLEEEMEDTSHILPKYRIDAEPVESNVETKIERSRGTGQPLQSDVRKKVETAFGMDFSGVRVHTDAEADTLNRELCAQAFATGQDIFFSKGAYAPWNYQGQKLLAHELTHTIQQKGSTPGRMSVVRPEDKREMEADQVANAVVHSHVNFSPIRRSPWGIYRTPREPIRRRLPPGVSYSVIDRRDGAPYQISISMPIVTVDEAINNLIEVLHHLVMTTTPRAAQLVRSNIELRQQLRSLIQTSESQLTIPMRLHRQREQGNRVAGITILVTHIEFPPPPDRRRRRPVWWTDPEWRERFIRRSQGQIPQAEAELERYDRGSLGETHYLLELKNIRFKIWILSNYPRIMTNQPARRTFGFVEPQTNEDPEPYFRTLYQRFDSSFRQMNAVYCTTEGEVNTENIGCQERFIWWWALKRDLGLPDALFYQRLNRIQLRFEERGYVMQDIQRLYDVSAPQA